jgi:hypothetical protein
VRLDFFHFPGKAIDSGWIKQTALLEDDFFPPGLRNYLSADCVLQIGVLAMLFAEIDTPTKDGGKDVAKCTGWPRKAPD